MKRQYHKYDSCNNFGGNKDYEVIDTIESHVSECRTKCKDCGFTDYWSTGFFESSQHIESKCKTYGAVITPPELTTEVTALKCELKQTKDQLYSLFERVSGCEVSEFNSEQVNYLADMIEGQMDADNGAIEKLKCELKQFKWISVKDRLPEFGDVVLVTFKNLIDQSMCVTADYVNLKVCAHSDRRVPTWYKHCSGGVALTRVTHWMSLPQPPTVVKGLV